MKNQPKPVSPTAAIRQSQDHVRLRASTEFNPFLRGTPKGGSEINKTNAVRKRLLGRSRVEKEEEEDQELDTDYSTPDADDDFPSPSLSPLSTASTPNLTPRSTRTASRNKFIDEFGILDPIPENTLDEYTKNALQEDLVGPAGSNLTPLASIEAEMLQGEIRTLCIITEPVFYSFIYLFILLFLELFFLSSLCFLFVVFYLFIFGIRDPRWFGWVVTPEKSFVAKTRQDKFMMF